MKTKLISILTSVLFLLSTPASSAETTSVTTSSAGTNKGNPYYRVNANNQLIICAPQSTVYMSRGLRADDISAKGLTSNVRKITLWYDAGSDLQTVGTRVLPDPVFAKNGVKVGNHFCTDPSFYVELMPAKAVFQGLPLYPNNWDTFKTFIDISKDGRFDLMNNRYDPYVYQSDEYTKVAASASAQRPVYYDPDNTTPQVGIRMFERDVDLARSMAGAQGTLLIDYALINVKRLKKYLEQRGFKTTVNLYTFQNSTWAPPGETQDDTYGTQKTTDKGSTLKVIKIKKEDMDTIFEDPRHLDLAQPGSDFNQALQQFHRQIADTPVPSDTVKQALFISDGEFMAGTQDFNFAKSCQIFKDANIPLGTMRFENKAFTLRAVAQMRGEFDRRDVQDAEIASKMRCDPDWALQQDALDKGQENFDPLPTTAAFSEHCAVGSSKPMNESIKRSYWFGGVTSRGYAYGSSRKKTTELMQKCANMGGGTLINVSKMLKLNRETGKLVDPVTGNETTADPIREMYKDYVLRIMPKLTSYTLQSGYRDVY